jgi:hypothetical protein
MFTVRAQEEVKWRTPENDLDEPVTVISTAIEKARQLNMNTSAYILVEVSEITKAGPNGA